jgi:hypothetical protein
LPRASRRRRNPVDVAFHEAGHLAVAHFLGRKILGEAFVDPKTLDGGSEVDLLLRQLSDAAPALARENLLIAMAGAAAECRRDRRKSRWNDGADIDRDTAEDYRRFRLDPNDFADVDRILARPDVWRGVRRIAAALEQDRRLPAERIEALLGRAAVAGAPATSAEAPPRPGSPAT